MKALLRKIILCIALVLTSLVTGVGNAYATSCASPAANQLNCVVDQQMTRNGGGDGFSGTIVLGQTFTPTQSGCLCRVDLLLQRNIPNVSSLMLRVVEPNLVPLPVKIIPPPMLTPNQATWVIFNFPCTAQLTAGTIYRLELSAPTTPAFRYTWINNQGAGGNPVYPRGTGWRNAGAGWVQKAYDYAFIVKLQP